MKYVDGGTRLPRVERFLDRHQTAAVRRGNSSSLGMRKVVEGMGGEWDCERPHNQYDNLNIPFASGTLIIERPWTSYPSGIEYYPGTEPNILTRFIYAVSPRLHRYLTRRPSAVGHRVSYEGDTALSFSAVKSFLEELFEREKASAVRH